VAAPLELLAALEPLAAPELPPSSVAAAAPELAPLVVPDELAEGPPEPVAGAELPEELPLVVELPLLDPPAAPALSEPLPPPLARGTGLSVAGVHAAIAPPRHSAAAKKFNAKSLLPSEFTMGNLKPVMYEAKSNHLPEAPGHPHRARSGPGKEAFFRQANDRIDDAVAYHAAVPMSRARARLAPPAGSDVSNFKFQRNSQI
jgi:hypothetical protein